jgi:molybdopterin-guanine dinucleotide biosynthesis protein A
MVNKITKKSNFSAAILAGGKNSRFNGENKSFLKINNQFVIEKIIEVLKEIFSEIMIVTNDKKAYSMFPDCKTVNDYYREIGPLGGIHAALQNALYENVFIVSCDMPFLNKNLIQKQINSHLKEKSNITIPVLNNFKEPLHGIYCKNVITSIENFIQTTDKYKIIGFFDLVKVNYFDVNQTSIKSFTNINNPDDYNKIVQKTKKPQLYKKKTNPDL